MGYSKSITTLQRRAHLLEPLTRGVECYWESHAVSASTMAYQLREALHIAQYHAQKEFPELAEAAKHFKISIVSPTRVEARRISILPEPSTEMNEKELAPAPLELEKKELKIHDSVTILEMISIVKESSPDHSPIIIMKPRLDGDELIKFNEWLPDELLMFWDGERVVIRDYEEELAELAFVPEDLEIP